MRLPPRGGSCLWKRERNQHRSCIGRGDIDTYCGVDSNGEAASYFGKGKATAFSSTFLPIYKAVSNAPNAAARTAALHGS